MKRIITEYYPEGATEAVTQTTELIIETDDLSLALTGLETMAGRVMEMRDKRRLEIARRAVVSLINQHLDEEYSIIDQRFDGKYNALVFRGADNTVELIASAASLNSPYGYPGLESVTTRMTPEEYAAYAKQPPAEDALLYVDLTFEQDPPTIIPPKSVQFDPMWGSLIRR